jgi:hypothetical protein
MEDGQMIDWLNERSVPTKVRSALTHTKELEYSPPLSELMEARGPGEGANSVVPGAVFLVAEHTVSCAGFSMRLNWGKNWVSKANKHEAITLETPREFL